MRITAILTLLVSSVVTLAVVPRTNTCFNPSEGACMGYHADTANATLAITNACNQVKSCTPGQTDYNRRRYRGIVKGFPYTAVLYVGDQCAGVTNWSTDACIALFNEFVDDRCDQQYSIPADKYQLGYITAPCDNSFVSFNFGG
ncbi:hypothetical protein DM02DRAFT_649933 [Periconia macrospinosa]|uniref:Uncharacterized protein n=1 Tax=Periconia macrospinosa TaxID=97972 RepID=A0A2V1E792_9PLEO|nr:hypothetical protein DM02DRAFT_649933 [Periconia macrospinosa]